MLTIIWLLYLIRNRDLKKSVLWASICILIVMLIGSITMLGIKEFVVFFINTLRLSFGYSEALTLYPHNNIFLLICSVVLVFASFSILKTSFGINEERNFGPTHYIMMGLNAERSGVFEEEDVLYSNSFQTKAERQRANVQVIKERLNNYGPLGFIKLLVNKALINFNDGSFAWEVEGNFYKELLPDNNKIFAPIFMNYYSSYEDYDNTVFKQIVQSLWLWVLIFSLGFLFKTPVITVS